MKLANVGIMLLSVMAHAGCHSESNTAPAAAQPAKKVAAVKKPEDPLAKMAQAVGSGKPGAAVQLKYDILGKPQVGVPVDIELAIIPQVDAETLTLHIGGMDGLVLSGDLEPTSTMSKFLEPSKFTFKATPAQAGVFYATVTAELVHNGVSMSRTFTVPMVVGTAATEQKPTVAPKRDATGQAIQSMPAEKKH